MEIYLAIIVAIVVLGSGAWAFLSDKRSAKKKVRK